MDFIDRIDKLLLEKNLKRQALAEYAGIAKSTFSMWKKRHSFPQANVALKIAEYLETSIEYLVSGKEPSGLKPEVAELARAMEPFKPEDIEAVKALVNVLGKKYNYSKNLPHV